MIWFPYFVHHLIKADLSIKVYNSYEFIYNIIYKKNNHKKAPLKAKLFILRLFTTDNINYSKHLSTYIESTTKNSQYHIKQYSICIQYRHKNLLKKRIIFLLLTSKL